MIKKMLNIEYQPASPESASGGRWRADRTRKNEILQSKKGDNLPSHDGRDQGEGWAFKMIELEKIKHLKIENRFQDMPPVEEPPNEPQKPPVKEPGDPTEPPAPPAEPPVKEPPNEPGKPPVKEPPPKDPDREPPQKPPIRVCQ